MAKAKSILLPSPEYLGSPRNASIGRKDPHVKTLRLDSTAEFLCSNCTVRKSGKMRDIRNPSLRRALAWFSSLRENREFARIRDEYGKANADEFEAFQYRSE